MPPAKDQATLFEEGVEAFKYSLQQDYFHARAESIRGYTSVPFSGVDAEEVARLLSKHYANAKLVFIARDPLPRIESEFRELHRNGCHYGIRCPYNLADAIAEVPTLVDDCCYFSRLAKFRRYFPDEQIKVLLLEDFQEQPLQIVNDLCEFLDVTPFSAESLPHVHINQSVKHRYDSKELRRLRDDPRHPDVARALNDLPSRISDQLLAALGLRLQFDNTALDWTAEAVDNVVDKLCPDLRQFLRYIDRSPDVWPRFNATAADQLEFWV